MKDKILNDIIIAMKNKDKDKLATLRLLKGAIQLEEISKKTDLTDDEIISIISKQIKTRSESMENFKKANRKDLITKTEQEIEILNEYMPKQLSKEEVVNIIKLAFDEIKPTSIKQMKEIMAYLNPKLKGRTDMKMVSQIVKEKLSL